MIKTVLAFGAHPDDVELGCGGTLARYVQAGWLCRPVIATLGEAGSMDVSPGILAATRRVEACAAARSLGLGEPIFLGYPDGLTAFTPEMKYVVIDILRRMRPDVVFVHSRTDRFPDHAVVSGLVLAGIVGAAGPWYQGTVNAAADLVPAPPYPVTPWAVETVLGYEVWQPLNEHQLAVDITQTMERKVAALRMHESQVGPTRYDESARGLARYRGVMSFAGEYAEVFEVIKLGRLPELG